MLFVKRFDTLSANKIDPPSIFLFLKFAFKPVTGSINKKDPCVVNNSIDDRCCHHIVLEDLPPVLSNRDELKQEIGLLFRNRHISQLVNNQQVEPRIG